MNFEPEFLSVRKKRRPPLRTCRLEPLEYRIALDAATVHPANQIWETSTWTYQQWLNLERLTGAQYSGGVSVSATKIFTETEIIPRFVAEPTITNVSSGDWSDPGVWSLGRVPTDGDRVAIAPNTVLTYSEVNDARLDGVEINGSLIFTPTVNTRLIAGNLTVMPAGRLQIGTAALPVVSGVKAELVIADKPLDPQLDPRQYGTGLIALGQVTIHGSLVAQTWNRLAAEPKAGDRSLLVDGSVANWRPGDTLVLPDTRQVRSSEFQLFTEGQIAPESENVVIDHVEGNRVFLTDSLQFDHLGARNVAGQLELLPHVALLNRNVIIRSENPGGTRGHTFFTGRAQVDIAFARFQDLGRTDALRNLDNTQIDVNGVVTHLGTNQVGRYAVHFHHLLGPENPKNAGYQFRFEGNTVERSLKWAIAVHDTSFGFVSRNVVYDAQGAGIVTEDGSEIGNLFINNITIRMQGTYQDGESGTFENDYGRGGVGFWFRRGGNNVVGNVAADSTYAGFVFDGYNTAAVVLPLFRGAEKHEPGQGKTTELSPVALLVRNEAYGMSTFGLWAAYVAGNNLVSNQPLTQFVDLRLWHISRAGVVAYHTSRLKFDRLLILGDLAAQNQNYTGTRGIDLSTYENFDTVVFGSRIEGVRYGILAPPNDATQDGIERPTVIRNSILKNYINIVVLPPRDDLPSAGNVLEVRDVKFELVTQLPIGPISPALLPPPANIEMRVGGENVDLTKLSIVRVTNYNQVPGDNFQVYYREQAPEFVLAQTDPAQLVGYRGGVIGSPEAGLTNLQNWMKYGIAMGGGLAPFSASASRAEIVGLIAPIQDRSLLTPRVVLVTPWNGAQLPGYDLVRIRYNVIGLLPAGTRVYIQLDGVELDPASLFNLPSGEHTLRAFIGDANGQLLPGTIAATNSFVVLP